MVTISGRQPKRRAEPSIAKYGRHFMDCVRQTKPYCRTHKKKGETVAQCSQGICHYHMRYGSCAIGEVHKFNAAAKRNRSGPGKQYLARLEKRRKKHGKRN